MIHCTDLIRALEQYLRGYGDRSSIERLLAMARRNLEDPRVFAWQRDRLVALVDEIQTALSTTETQLSEPLRRPAAAAARPNL